MANLGTFRITTTTHADLAALTSLTFSSGNNYRIQSYTNDFWLREGTTGEGDLIPAKEFAYVENLSGDLYIKTGPSGVLLNIAQY